MRMSLVLLCSLSLLASGPSNSSHGSQDRGAVINCLGDITSNLGSAIAKTAPVGDAITLRGMQAGTNCVLTRSLKILSGMRLIGVNRPVIKLTITGQAFLGDTRSTSFLIRGLTLDASKASRIAIIALRGTPSGRFEDLRLINPGDGIALSEGTHDVAVTNLVETGSGGNGVAFINSYNNVVDGADLEGQAKFGVVIGGDSHGNRLNHLRTTHSGLELVGITAGSRNNTLSNSVAARTGDNCYSITGNYNKIFNIEGDHCAGNGITFYGSYNTLVGGVFTDNNQRFRLRKAWSAAVQFSQGFGGVAQNNFVRRIWIDDDQTPPSQQVGIMTFGFIYRQWVPRVRIAVGEYRRAGLFLYRASKAGVTGLSAPKGQGFVSDGGVTWQYVNVYSNSTGPDNNQTQDIDIHRTARAPREDQRVLN
jgi:hypothetical protein